MNRLEIWCENCRGSWEILERDEWNEEKYRTCPDCGNQIDEQTWKRFIIPAFGSIIDANCQLIKDSLNKHSKGFKIRTNSTRPSRKEFIR